MTRKQDLQKLLTKNARRLQKLKEQKAVEGRATDPEILIEIEDLEMEIEKLQAAWEILSTENEAVQPPQSHSPAPGPWQVLVVDDDPSWQTRLKRILRRINCTVVTAGAYDEAEAELSNTTLDLITIDLNLDTTTNYADGLELISRIRERFGPTFPLIIVTGQGDLSRQRRAFKDYDVFDFIEKAKFDFEEFQETVIEAITASG